MYTVVVATRILFMDQITTANSESGASIAKDNMLQLFDPVPFGKLLRQDII